MSRISLVLFTGVVLAAVGCVEPDDELALGEGEGELKHAYDDPGVFDRSTVMVQVVGGGSAARAPARSSARATC